MKELILIVVTATVTVVVCQWVDRPAPFCCPGGEHYRIEGGKWGHRFPDAYENQRPREPQK